MQKGIALGGFMGVGKSAVGQELSGSLDLPFHDLDTILEDEFGPISEQFMRDGEDAFRALESAQLRAVLDGDRTIVAAGGGAPCQGQAMDDILAAGPCVWLSASLPVIAGRVIDSEERPLLGTVDADRIVEHLAVQLEHRQQVYNRASFAVSTDGLEPLAVVEAIESHLQARGEGPWAP